MLSTISVATPEVDSRLTHPPNVGMEDFAQFWGAYFNIVLPINWFICFVMMTRGSAGRSE